MKKFLWIATITLLSVAPLLHASESSGVVVSHYESLDNLTISRGETVGLQKPQQVAGPLLLSFDAFGQSFDLELEPNNRLITQAIRGELADDIGVYRGHLAGEPDSWVRIVVSNGEPTGLIWDGEQMLAIEAPHDSALSTNTTAIYRLADTYIRPGTMSCGTSGGGDVASTAYQKLTTELQNTISQAPGASEEINIGMVGDFEFTDSMGSGAEAAILTRMNNVDGIFSDQLGVQITVPVVDLFTDSSDPFTTSVPGDLLDEVANYRILTPTQNSQGLTHLFTGRDLDTSTVGISFRDSLCSSRFASGLSEGRRGATTDSLIAAHEIGHIFGAPHDGQSGSACESETGAFIMAPTLNGSNQFSSCSISIMQPNADRASCINPLPETDVSIGISSPVPNLLLGNTNDLVFDVSSNGTLNADNVQADFTFPTNISVNSVSASTGTCTAGAGQASCSLGTIAGNSSQTVTLSVTASAVGSETLDATVTADADSNVNNNAQSIQIVVDPATDLVVTGANTASIIINSSTVIRPQLENLSVFDATNVVLDVTFSSGLRVDSASWSIGACTIGTDTIQCTGSSLAAQSTATIDISVTATSVGSQTYDATVSSDEVDRDESNNAATGTVTVRADAGGTDSGGGGSVGPIWLFLALLIRLIGTANRQSGPALRLARKR